MSSKKEIKVVHTRTIESERFLDTEYVFFSDTIVENDGETETKKITYGVTLREHVEAVKGLNRICLEVPAAKLYEGKATVKIITNENWNRLMAAEIDVTRAVDAVDKNSNDGVHVVLYRDSVIADLDGNLLAVPIHLDYCEADINNKSFHLEQLLERLKADDRVLNREDLKISLIPSYNCYGGRDKTISFKVLISNEEYEKFRLGDWYGRYQYLIDEVLNLKDCRIEEDDLDEDEEF